MFITIVFQLSSFCKGRYHVYLVVNAHLIKSTFTLEELGTRFIKRSTFLRRYITKKYNVPD